MTAGDLGFELPDSACGLKAVHLRHFAIHENQAVWEAPEHLDRFGPVRGEIDTAALAFESQLGHPLVGAVVIHGEHACVKAVCGPGGSRGADDTGLRLHFAPGQRCHDRVEERRRLHWLRERRGEMALALHFFRVGRGGRSQQSDGVHVGDLTIQHGDVVRIARLRRGAQHVERFATGRRASVAHLPADDLLVEHLAVDRVVRDNERPQAGDIRGRQRGRCRGGVEREREYPCKGRAFARSAADAKLSAHQLDKPLADREPQP